MSGWADHQAIVDLTLAYAWALDSCDWDGLDLVFSADATADLLGRTSVGRPAIVARIRTSLEPFDATQHIVSNHQVAIAGDTATCRSYLQAQHVRQDTPGGDTFTIGGYYEDKIARLPDGWRIIHRTLVATWTEGNPRTTGRN